MASAGWTTSPPAVCHTPSLLPPLTRAPKAISPALLIRGSVKLVVNVRPPDPGAGSPVLTMGAAIAPAAAIRTATTAVNVVMRLTVIPSMSFPRCHPPNHLVPLYLESPV